MISFFLKTPKQTNFVKTTRLFIQEIYESREMEDAVMSKLKYLQALRQKMCSAIESNADSETLMDLHRDYYGHFSMIFSAVPYDAKQCPVNFTWGDSYRVDKKAVSSSLEFEKNSVLFNIATITSKICLKRPRETKQQIKIVMKDLIKTASLYAHLFERSKKLSLEEKTMDFSRTNLQFSALFMQAQAQTCLFEIAQMEQFSVGMVTELAMAAAETFKKASEKIEGDQALRSWLKKGDYPFHLHVDFQAEMMFAVTFFWRSKTSLSEKKYGNEIAWLSLSKKHIKNAENIKKKNLVREVVSSFNLMKTTVEKRYNVAIDDNNSIYHDRVDNESELIKPKARLMANISATDLSDLKMRNEGEFLQGIVPGRVAKMGQILRKRLVAIINDMKGRNDAENEKHRLVLSEHDHYLPRKEEAEPRERQMKQFQFLFDEIDVMKQRGGYAYLGDSLRHIHNEHSQAVRKLNLTKIALDQDEKADEEKRIIYADYWRISPSRTLTEKYRKEIESIEGYLLDANKSNEKMERRLSKFESTIRMLSSKGVESISKTLPLVTDENADLELLTSIRQTLKLMVQLLREKDDAVKEVRGQIALHNFSATVMEIRRDGDVSKIDMEKVIQKIETANIYPVLERLKTAESRLRAQHAPLDSLVAKMARSNETNPSLVEKRKNLSLYKATVENYKALTESFEAGKKFYRELKEFCLETLFAKVYDFSNARKIERDRAVEQLQQMFNNSQANYFDNGQQNDRTGGNFRY